jgi:hypothetical protein
VLPDIISWALPFTGQANSTGLNAKAGVLADKADSTTNTPEKMAKRRDLPYAMQNTPIED